MNIQTVYPDSELFDDFTRYVYTLMGTGISKTKAKKLARVRYPEMDRFNWTTDGKAKNQLLEAYKRNAPLPSVDQPAKLPGLDNGAGITAVEFTRWHFQRWINERGTGLNVGDVYTFSPTLLVDIYKLFTGNTRSIPAFTNEFTPGQSSKLQSEGWAFEPEGDNTAHSYSFRITAIPNAAPDPRIEIINQIIEQQRKLQEMIDKLK